MRAVGAGLARNVRYDVLQILDPPCSGEGCIAGKARSYSIRQHTGKMAGLGSEPLREIAFPLLDVSGTERQTPGTDEWPAGWMAAQAADVALSSDSSWLIRLPQEDMCQASGVSGNLKYEADGGPSMVSIMDILLGSLDSYADRITFMKSQLLFWMLGAIDGHAKNFSIFHMAGPTYRLTPLYDVISIYPIVAGRQLDRQRVRMAMAVHGRNRHYRWHMISRRHWLETARKCRFAAEDMESLIEECCDRTDSVIEYVGSRLPSRFPTGIADAIFKGVIAARDRLLRAYQ